MTTETITYEDVARDADIDPEAFEAYCLNQHIKPEESDDYVVSFMNDYIGQFDRAADFAENFYEENGDLLRVPSAIISNIDWQGVWNYELRYDFYEVDGYYFRN